MDVDQDAALDEPQMVDEPQETPTNRRARVEDAVDEGDEPTRTFTKPYPSDRKAGFILRHGSPPAQFEFGHLHGDGTNDYFPFADRSEWEIAQWVKNEAISDAAFDRFCKIPSVRTPARSSPDCPLTCGLSGSPTRPSRMRAI